MSTPNSTPRYEQIRASQEERSGFVDQLEADVNHADELNKEAAPLEEQVRAHDSDEAFRQAVSEDRKAFRNRIAFLATLILIALADFGLGTPDASEYLASKMMVYVPQWLAPHNPGELLITPVWVRAITGIILVGVFLAVTLKVKKESDESALQLARHDVEPGDHRSYKRITNRIWLCRSMKVIYMIVIGVLLMNLWFYDRQRSILLTKTFASVKALQHAEKPKLAIGFPSVASHEETAHAGPADSASQENGDTGLARASAVVFCALWCLHGLILLRNSGFERDLEYGRFRRTVVVEETRAMRSEEARLLRNIYRRIRTAPETDRDEFIEIAVPVIPRINEIYDRIVIRLPDAENDAAYGSRPEHPDDPTPQPIAPSDPPLGGPGNNGVMARHVESADSAIQDGEHNNGSSEISVNTYDAIFPRATPA